MKMSFRKAKASSLDDVLYMSSHIILDLLRVTYSIESRARQAPVMQNNARNPQYLGEKGVTSYDVRLGCSFDSHHPRRGPPGSLQETRYHRVACLSTLDSTRPLIKSTST